jgi:ABC-2 type transport system ATP-binding protein
MHRPVTDSVVELVGLSKRFGSGVLAVDNLSFSVAPGQVCGLLGPNGAGKTTALRILLGLIKPTRGEAFLFGTRVRPGVDELQRVGAIIETAAFVPHLSGMRNLKLWWQAGGRKFADADVEGALAVAGLGDAIHRKVKTYSQGMRQRLGLARVLLGRPDVLVLDEPTNGLDPGELREVRQLVHRVAEAGATVLFSSHILAEVEQTCTHAVVMDKGHLVAAGSVADLIGSSGVVYLEVDDVGVARGVLERLPSVQSVDPEPPGLAVGINGGSRSELVAELVRAGVGVETVTARRRLEDAFLGMVEADE